jgi:hypothetical protein
MLSTLRLFKSLPVETHDVPATVDEAAIKATLAKGFVLAPEVVANYPDSSHILALVEQAYGRDSEALNASFHKSFAKVRDTSLEQLVFEQMVHYLTTYGAETLGVYSQESVFIPGERLDAPELKDGVRLIVIRGLTKDELKAELLKLLGSGIALHERTVQDALDVATFVGFTAEDIEQVKNREVKAALYDAFGIVPHQPVEFLRFVVYRATNKTLLIKNAALIEEIKGQQNIGVARYFAIYEREVGLERLAEIFYRYKPLFLAFRTTTTLKKTINKIRRLATTHHKPMQEDALNSVTAHLSHHDGPDLASLNETLGTASTFRKIRLAYALKFRTTGPNSILYRMRNGKSFATAFTFDNLQGAQEAYDVVLASITEDLAANMRGKRIFIPEGIRYGVPATEKQFTGNLPSGTSVEVTDDMVCGVHWENQGSHRIDLDLSISNAEGKIGWDGRYRAHGQGVYFSGDLTDAPQPKGASELFHIGRNARGSWLMFVNYFNYQEDVSVPFKIMVGSDSKENIEANRTIDPNLILALSNTDIDVKQKNLGIIVATEADTKFYFAESNLGKSITARDTDYAEHARTYLLHYYTDTIVLNDLLVAAGAIMVKEATEADIDLSPEAIDKTTIIGLLSPKIQDVAAMSGA